jgi:hypothetical protein
MHTFLRVDGLSAKCAVFPGRVSFRLAILRSDSVTQSGQGAAMSADLHLTSQVLDDLISGFSGFGGRLGSACADISNGDSALTGTDPLAGQVHGFAGSWNYGLTQLGQHGTECVRMLRQVGTTFDRLDHELASELSRVKEHG